MAIRDATTEESATAESTASERATDDSATDNPAWTRREHRTTLVLQELTDGLWRATQEGADVAGTGETAPEAAADYCRQIDEKLDE